MSEEIDEPSWFYVNQYGEKQGPYRVAEFKELANEGLILSDTLVWSPSYPDWLPARELAGLVPSELSQVVQSASESAVEPAPIESAPVDVVPLAPVESSAPVVEMVDPALMEALPEKTQESATAGPESVVAVAELEPVQDERLKPRQGSFLFPRIIFGFVVSLILGVVAGVACGAVTLSPFLGLVAFAVAFLLVLAIFIYAAFVSYKKERYELTSSTVLCHQGGLFSDQTIEVEICNVTHVSLKLPWIRHKLFGIGTISIDSAGTSKPVLLNSIKTPQEVYQRIAERMKRNGYQLRKENLLHEERPAVAGLILTALQIGVGVFVALSLGWSTLGMSYMVASEMGVEWLVGVLAVLFVFASLVFLVVYFLDMRRRVYRVYDDAVVYYKGFLTRFEALIPYENIADASTKQKFLEKVFNIYNVVISCQGGAKEIKFNLLQRGVELSDCIDELVIEANKNPSPAELMSGQSSAQSVEGEFARDEPALVLPENAWTTDLRMNPARTLVPLLILLPAVPLWISATIRAVIAFMCTNYTVGGGSIGSSYRFFTTNEREFAYDKITGLVVKENLWDRMFKTFTLQFWSIGSSKTLELAHVKKNEVDLEAVLNQIGIPTETEEEREIATKFSPWAWMRAHPFALFFGILLTVGLIAGAVFSGETILFTLASVPALLAVIGLAYSWGFYSQQRLSFRDHHVEATQGIIARSSYFARYRNVKKNLVTQYPCGKDGSLQIFVAGEQMIGQENEKKGGSKITKPCSFTLGYLPRVFSKGQLLDDILGGRVEVSPWAQPADPLPVVVESKRGLGNSLVTLILLSIILFPLLLIFPITLPLTIIGVKRCRYRVEAGRVASSWGIFFKREATVLLNRVDSLQQRQGFLNKIFKNGQVSIMTAGSSKPDLEMPAAETYQALYKEIKQLSKKG